MLQQPLESLKSKDAESWSRQKGPPRETASKREEIEYLRHSHKRPAPPAWVGERILATHWLSLP